MKMIGRSIGGAISNQLVIAICGDSSLGNRVSSDVWNIGCALASASAPSTAFRRMDGSSSIQQEVSMSDLVAIVYPSEAKAEEVRQRLLKLQKEYLITISDAVIAVKTEAGGIKLNQLVNTTAIGAMTGSFWGLLIGVLFLNPILGVALGAASGALSGALSDFGIDDAFMKNLSASLQPDNAALFLLIKHMTADKVLNEIKDAGGVVLKTSLDETKEKVLRDALASAAERPAA